MNWWIVQIRHKYLHGCFLCTKKFLSIKEMHQILSAIARISRNCPRKRLEWEIVQKWVHSGAKPSFFTPKCCTYNGAENGVVKGSRNSMEKGGISNMEGGRYRGGIRIINSLLFNIISCRNSGLAFDFSADIPSNILKILRRMKLMMVHQSQHRLLQITLHCQNKRLLQ